MSYNARLDFIKANVGVKLSTVNVRCNTSYVSRQ